MEILTGIGAVLTGAAGGVAGGLFGVVGKWLARKQEIEADRQQMERDDKSRAHEIALLKLQMESRTEETERERDLAREAGSWKGLTASLKADAAAAAGILPNWVRSARSLARLVFTLVLGGLTLWIWRDLIAAIESGSGSLTAVLPPDATEGLLRYIVYSVVFSFSTAVAWWFGDRAMTPPGAKHR